MRQRLTTAGDSRDGAAADQSTAFMSPNNVVFADGVVTWSIEGVTVPCIIRGGKPHGPVRILENELLNSLSSTAAVNAAFQDRRLLVSKYLTDLEALRLTYATGGKFGMFTSKDLVVDIDDFRELHGHLKSVLHNWTTAAVTGGWVQLNNSVIPYLSVNDRKLLPLPVVMNAAGLLWQYSTRVLRLQYPSDAQCRYLNELCATAGLDFRFRTSTELVDIAVVSALTHPPPYVRELPGKDPFLHAYFIDESLLGTSTSAAASHEQWRTASLDDVSAGLAVSHPSLSSLPATSQVVPQAIGTAARGSNQPAPTQTLTVIEPVSFRGRTISSLRRPADSNHYILLDAVCRVFFPQHRNVDGFIRAIETLFHIPEVRMSEAEQQHFISFYKLPTDRLTYNKLIRLDLLSDIFPRLDRMFSAEVSVAEGQLLGSVIARPASDSATTSHGTSAIATCTTSTATTTNDTKSGRKRRRNDIGTDIVVID